MLLLLLLLFSWVCDLILLILSWFSFLWIFLFLSCSWHLWHLLRPWSHKRYIQHLSLSPSSLLTLAWLDHSFYFHDFAQATLSAWRKQITQIQPYSLQVKLPLFSHGFISPISLIIARCHKKVRKLTSFHSHGDLNRFLKLSKLQHNMWKMERQQDLVVLATDLQGHIIALILLVG